MKRNNNKSLVHQKNIKSLVASLKHMMF